jgi:hypothetical protein
MLEKLSVSTSKTKFSSSTKPTVSFASPICETQLMFSRSDSHTIVPLIVNTATFNAVNGSPTTVNISLSLSHTTIYDSRSPSQAASDFAQGTLRVLHPVVGSSQTWAYRNHNCRKSPFTTRKERRWDQPAGNYGLPSEKQDCEEDQWVRREGCDQSSSVHMSP